MPVINDFAVNGTFPATISTLGTSTVYFPRLLGASIGVESVAPSATSAKGQLVVPGNNELNGQNFQVRIGGSIVGGAAAPSTNATIILRANTGTETTPVYTTIASTGAVALNPLLDGVAENFTMTVTLFGTTASGIVQGNQTSQLSTTVVATSALTANLSGINFGNANPFGLVIGVTFSVASTGAANVATLNQFQITAN